MSPSVPPPSPAAICTDHALLRLLLRLPCLWNWLNRPLNALQPLVALAGRIYIAQVFFASGLTKLRDWSVTLTLFTDDYKVPVLPPELAAYLGTAGELGLPVLLVLGLGGRIAPLGLFVVNLVAANALDDLAPAALQQHISWGIVLAALGFFGTGAWTLDCALDYYVKKRSNLQPCR